MNGQWQGWGHLGRPQGSSHIHRIAVGRNEDGRLEVFAIDTDGALWQIWQTAPNNGWSSWESRGRPTAEGIELSSQAVGKSLALGRNRDGRQEVVVIASRELWRVGQVTINGGWGSWQQLGQPVSSGGLASLELARNEDGRLQIFALGFDGQLASIAQLAANQGWGAWSREFPRDPALPVRSLVVGQNEDGRLELVVDLNGILALVTQAAPGGAFRSGFGNLGLSTGSTRGPLSMARNADGTLETALTVGEEVVSFRQRAANQEPSPGGGGWLRHDLERPAEPVAVRSPVLATNHDARLEVFVQGSDGNIYHRWQSAPNAGWDDWHSLGSPSPSGEGFSAFDVGQNQDGRLEVFTVRERELWTTWQADAP